MRPARRSVRLAWPGRHDPAQSHGLERSQPASGTAGTWYDTRQTHTCGGPSVQVEARVTCNAGVTRRPRLALVTLGCLAAVLELLEMGRWVLIAAQATWDWWYAAELAVIVAGIVTVSAMLYREWQR